MYLNPEELRAAVEVMRHGVSISELAVFHQCHPRMIERDIELYKQNGYAIRSNDNV